MRIQTILFSAVFAIVFVIILFGYLTYITAQSEIEKLVGAHLESLSLSMMNQLDQEVENRVEELQTFATRGDIREILLKSNEEYAKLKDPTQFILEQDKNWISTPPDEISPFMAEIINHKLSQDLRNHQIFLEDKHGYSIYGEIFITNAYGANVVQTGKTSDFKQDDEQWWQKAKLDGLYVGDLDYDESAGIFSIDLTVKINDENENFIGVMKGVYNIKAIIVLMDDLKTSFEKDNTSILDLKLVDKNGKLVHTTSHEKLFEKISEEEFLSIEGKSGYFISRGDKSDKLHAYSVSDSISELNIGWVSIIENDLDKAMKSAFVLRNSLIAISIALIAFSFTMWIGLTRFISKPLLVLQNSTKKITEGNYNIQLPEKGTSEVRELSKSFNVMTTSLKINDKLIRKQIDELKELDEKKRQFLNIISHELKTPLFPIQGNLEVLLKPDVLGKLNKDQLESIEQIQKNTNRLESRINELILVNLIISGKLDFKKETITIKDLMDEAKKDSKMLISTKNFNFVNSTKDDFSLVTDKTRVKDVLFQLVQNAAEHIPAENGEIEINAEERDDQIIFYVKDNGVGISTKTQKDLFKEFYQVDMSHRRKHQGLGLGLTICKGIAEGLGGKIWVESEEGKGATFYFTIQKI